MDTEADKCRKHGIPLLDAGWNDGPHSIAEQRAITDGRIVPAGSSFIRNPPKRVDFLLGYRATSAGCGRSQGEYRTAADAVQQTRLYAGMLGLKFAYATNEPDIIEVD